MYTMDLPNFDRLGGNRKYVAFTSRDGNKNESVHRSVVNFVRFFKNEFVVSCKCFRGFLKNNKNPLYSLYPN